QPQPQPQPQQSARTVAPLPQGATGLGDRLRAERQAAERLAEQRVAQARGRSAERPQQPPQNQPRPAASQNQIRPAPPTQARPAPQPGQVTPVPSKPAPAQARSAAPERPKFSFSPEELAKDKREAKQ